MSSNRNSAAPSPVEWILLAASLVLSQHYFWFWDDAFIYFRYADNLLFLEHGLVYNAGEYAEGYSSPGWMLVLLALRAMHSSWWLIVRGVGAIACVTFGLLLVRLNRSMSPRGVRSLNFPLAYLGLSYGVLTWFTSGVESPVVLVAAVVHALAIRSPGSRALQAAVGLTPILRHELVLPLLVFFVWCRVKTGRSPWTAASVALAALGSWSLFRIYYYADLFPTTFYLKDTVDLPQGLTYLRETLVTYHAYVVLLVLGLGYALRGPGVELFGRERFVMLVAAVSSALYAVKIGGGPIHFRYLAFPFCLAACSTAGLLEHAAARADRPLLTRLSPIVLIAFAALVHTFTPPQLGRHPIWLERAHDIRQKIDDAHAHRMAPEMQYEVWSQEVNIEILSAYRRAHPVDPSDATYPRSAYTTIGADGRCHRNYRDFDARIVHWLGLTDPFLARVEMKADRPAHKRGLKPLARDMAVIHAQSRAFGRGMYRAAIESGIAAPWIAENLETIETIERKAYNTHDWAENLELAFTFPPRIEILTPPEPISRPATGPEPPDASSSGSPRADGPGSR